MPQMLAKRLPEAEAKPETLLESLKTGPSCSPLACRVGAQIGPNSLTQIAAALRGVRDSKSAPTGAEFYHFTPVFFMG